MSSISQATTLFAITLVLLRSRMKTYLWVQRRSEDPRSISTCPPVKVTNRQPKNTALYFKIHFAFLPLLS